MNTSLSNNNIMELIGLNFGYAKAQQNTLENVQLQMKKGDILGLLGVNGAGKTTLVSLITGLQKPTSGSILIDGKPARLGRQDIAYVPQEYAFYERLSARENLNYFAGVLKVKNPSNIVKNVLERLNLEKFANKPCYGFSGGEKRRLNFAIAMLKPCALLILDEPTANVDPHSRALILEIIREQNFKGTSIIYTSHLLTEVEQLCNQVALLHKGKIKLQGALADLLAPSELTLELSFSENDQPKLQQLPNYFQTRDNVTHLKLNSQITLVTVFQQLQQHQLEPKTIQYGQTSLEAFFLQATQDERLINL